MLDTRFPLWYPFQEIDAIEFKVDKVDEIERLIEERKNLYNGEIDDYKFKKSSYETEEEFLDRISVDRKAYTILKMGVAQDPKLTAWFVEVEGDLFIDRLRNAKWEVKAKIFDDLFPIDKFYKNWMYLDDLSDLLGEDLKEKFNIVDEETRLKVKSRFKSFEHPSFGLQKVIGINFRYASYLVRTRKSKLYRGWVIDTVDRLMTTVKKRYEHLLREELKGYAERIETEAPGPIKRLAAKINEILKQSIRVGREIDFSHYEFEGEIDDNLLLFPPCIQDLMSIMKNVGYLKHHNRFQLGLFLKHLGMDVEEQMLYWYNFAVDNLNISYEEFEKNVGYTIRHLYGLEGKKVDYKMMSCGTIQSTGNYYCRFQDMNIDNINDKIKEYLTSLPGQEQAIKLPMAQEIQPLVAKGNPSEACGKFLEMTHGLEHHAIIHPLQYLERAAKVSDRVKKRNDEQSEEEITDD